MPAVLTMLVAVTALAGAIDGIAVSSMKTEGLWSKRAGADWVLNAAINRAAKAVVTPGDPMREGLFARQAVAWTFGGEQVALRLEYESEKIDVNFADEERAHRVLARVLGALPAPALADVAGRLESARSKRLLLASPEVLLPLDQRFGAYAKALKRSMTAFSGRAEASETSGLDSAGAEQDRDSSASSPASRPIYRLSAALVRLDPARVPRTLTRDVILMLSANDQRVFRVVEGHL